MVPTNVRVISSPKPRSSTRTRGSRWTTPYKTSPRLPTLSSRPRTRTQTDTIYATRAPRAIRLASSSSASGRSLLPLPLLAVVVLLVRRARQRHRPLARPAAEQAQVPLERPASRRILLGSRRRLRPLLLVSLHSLRNRRLASPHSLPARLANPRHLSSSSPHRRRPLDNRHSPVLLLRLASRRLASRRSRLVRSASHHSLEPSPVHSERRHSVSPRSLVLLLPSSRPLANPASWARSPVPLERRRRQLDPRLVRLVPSLEAATMLPRPVRLANRPKRQVVPTMRRLRPVRLASRLKHQAVPTPEPRAIPSVHRRNLRTTMPAHLASRPRQVSRPGRLGSLLGSRLPTPLVRAPAVRPARLARARIPVHSDRSHRSRQPAPLASLRLLPLAATRLDSLQHRSRMPLPSHSLPRRPMELRRARPTPTHRTARSSTRPSRAIAPRAWTAA